MKSTSDTEYVGYSEQYDIAKGAMVCAEVIGANSTGGITSTFPKQVYIL